MASRFKINCKKTDVGGFALIELVAVLVIAGILLSVVLSRTSAVADHELAAQVKKIKTQLRYAQIRAMDTDSVWGIAFEGSGYHLFKDGNTADKALLLGEETIDVDLPDGVVLNRIVSFDGWGRPSETADGASLATGDMTLSFGTIAITICKNTGYIP